MKALQSITDLFKAQVVDAKSFDVWAEDGAMFCGQGPLVDGYELEYTAIIFIQNVSLEPHVLFMHLVNWLNKYDPYRQEKGLAFPTFAVELLDKGKCDIKIKIDLRESYILQENANGNWMQGDVRYECASEFEPVVDPDELGELIYFVGHLEDLPCS
ncbi:phage tail protein [Vibrio sp. JC009]|uniref:phage tail protein n=1 Tax=Vibrio sp. JC009 TaxID=2912314 RepID=UPI0023B0D755|nr:phage tail protein [Vibrio sp. JC009]WED23517.1 phage tail protein [Vibrio sp. JC009]